MDVLKVISVGGKVEIEKIGKFESRSDKESTGIFSQIMDIERDLVHISRPMKHGMKYPLEIGDKIFILFFTQQKGIIRVRGEVTKVYEDPIVIFGIRLVGDAKKIQRRYHFRLNITKELTMVDIERDERISCISKDLSGGGLKCIVDRPLHVGDPVEITVDIDDDEIQVLGEVVRAIKNPIDNKYELGIKFNNISETDQNKIVSYLFQKQREFRKKGLI